MTLTKKYYTGTFALILFVAITVGISKEAKAMQGIQNDTMRLGIGIASLATKKCDGYVLGPGSEKSFQMLKAKTPQERAIVLELAEKEASKFLKAQGRDICDLAGEMAVNGNMLKRV